MNEIFGKTAKGGGGGIISGGNQNGGRERKLKLFGKSNEILPFSFFSFLAIILTDTAFVV